MSYNLTIAQLRYTKAQFIATNPVPLSGQLCIETDTNTSKVGDGSTAYASLPERPLSGEERTSADDVWAAGTRQPEVLQYIAYLTQTGTDAIVPTVLFNNTGVTPVFSYFDVGRQNCLLTGIDFTRVLVHDRFQDDIHEAKVGWRISLPYDDGNGNCEIQIQQCDISDYDAPTEFDGYGEKLGFCFSYVKP